MARAIEVPVVAKRGTLAKSIEGEAATAFRSLGRSSGAVAPLGRMLGRIRADADEFTKSIEASNARVIAFGASVGVINGISNAFKSLVATTINVEKKLTDINIVLGASQKGIAKFGDGLFKVAKNTAQSFDVVAEAATEFARQGLSIEETLKRTNDALILTRLTGLKAAESVKGLTAAVNGFGKAGLTTSQIINKLSAVDVQFAVGTDDLIDALSRAGAVAQDAGVSFDELVALVTVAQQRTARGGAVIGNAFKTIYTRIQDPKALAALREVKIAVDDVTGAALPANRVLQNLAQSYDGLNRTQKATIDQFVAGKFQINILKSVLGDLNTVNNEYSRAQQVSANATDQAIQKNEQLNKTLAALATQGGLAVEELAKKIGDISLGPGMRNILTTFNELVEGATRGLDGEGAGSNFAKGLLRGIGGILTGPGLIVIGGVFIKLFKDLTVFGVKSLKNLLGLNNASKQQAALQQGIGQLLATNVKFQQAIAAASGNTAKQAAVVNRFLATEVALRERAAAAGAKMAAGAFAGGFGVSAAGFITKGKGRRGAPSFAPTTGVPNFQHFETDEKGNKVFNVGQLMGSASAGGEFSGTHKVSTFLSKAVRKGKKNMPAFGEHLKAFLDANNVKYISAQQGSHMSGFGTPDSAKSFYKDVYSRNSPIDAVNNDMMKRIYDDGLKNMKEEAFAKDPVGAFNNAVNKHLPTKGDEVTASSRQAAALRSHYQRGAVEQGLMRKYGLRGFDHKNYMIDSVDRSGKPVEIKATMSRENSMSMMSKHIRSNQKLYDFLGSTKDPVSGRAIKGGRELRAFLDTQMMGGTGPFGQMKPGTLEHGMFGTVSHRHGGGAQGGAAFRRAFRKFATPLFPSFSPIGDAVKREKMQVGAMMGISPSNVKTKVVQNTALRSPFNPSGFGVISPTIGQNSFADARRMHKGEDLRTTNLPNFMTPLPVPGIDPLGGRKPLSLTATGYTSAIETVITGIDDKASKKLGDSVGAATVKAAERSAGKIPTTGVRMHDAPIGPAPEKVGRFRRAGRAIVGAGRGLQTVGGAAMGPAFTSMMLGEIGQGFFPGASPSQRIGMTGQQRIDADRVNKGFQYGGTGGAIGAVVGGGIGALFGGVGAVPGSMIGGTLGGAIGGGLGYARGGDPMLGIAERTQMVEQNMGARSSDMQAVDQARQALLAAGNLRGNPTEMRTALSKGRSALGNINDPELKRDILKFYNKAEQTGAFASAVGPMGETAAAHSTEMGKSIARQKAGRAVHEIFQAKGPANLSQDKRKEMAGIFSALDADDQGTIRELLSPGGGRALIGRAKEFGFTKTGLNSLRNFKDISQADQLSAMGVKGSAPGTIGSYLTDFNLAKQDNFRVDPDAKSPEEVNRFQAFMDMRRRLVDQQISQDQVRSRSAGATQRRQVAANMRFGMMERVGGTRSTIDMRFSDAMNEAGIADELARGDLAAGMGQKFANLKIGESPLNEPLMEAMTKALTGDTPIASAQKVFKDLNFKEGAFGGDKLDLTTEQVQNLENFSKELNNSAKLIEINTQNQKDYAKALQETAQTLDKQSMLVAGIEGFKNSLQSALQSIADPSMSGSKIGMNLLMGTLGSINQQASANVADAIGGKLGNFFGLGKKSQRGAFVPGSGTGDKVPAMLESKEYVLNRNAVAAVGKENLDAINFGMFPRFQTGGGVFGGVPSKHKRKALERFGNASFGPSSGGSALGGGGIGLNLGVFNKNLSSIAMQDPASQATRGFLRQERQKQIQKQFQKQAERDQLVSTIVGTGINVGLSAMMSGDLFKKKEQFTPDQSLIDTAAGYGHGNQSAGRHGSIGNANYGKGSISTHSGRGRGRHTPHGNRGSGGYFSSPVASGFPLDMEAMQRDFGGDVQPIPSGPDGARVKKPTKQQIESAKNLRRVADRLLLSGDRRGGTKFSFMDAVTPIQPEGLSGLEVQEDLMNKIRKVTGKKQPSRTDMADYFRNLADELNPAPSGSSVGGHLGQGMKALRNVFMKLMNEAAKQGSVLPIPPIEQRGRGGTGIIERQRGGSIDNIPAMLTGGEFVVNAGAVRKYGSNMFNSMNRFQSGGMIGNQKFVPQEGSAKSSDASSSTNNNTVNIAVNMGATGPTVSEDASGANNNSQSNGRDLGRKIRRAVLEVIEGEKRVSGKLRDPYAKS